VSGKRKKASLSDALISVARSELYLIFDSPNSTCLRALGSYFFMTSFSVCVREFFFVT
jgi:hypothetical protein